jgi:hypothetical protein
MNPENQIRRLRQEQEFKTDVVVDERRITLRGQEAEQVFRAVQSGGPLPQGITAVIAYPPGEGWMGWELTQNGWQRFTQPDD